jgi:hypothetical protein
MKAFIKRLLKVINMIITVPLWLLWAIIWVFFTFLVGIVALCTYVATGKDIMEWWLDKMYIITDLSIKINNKIDLL